MKLRKNDLIELKKLDVKGLVKKIADAKAQIMDIRINKQKEGAVKDIRATKTLKRSIAQLSTLVGMNKGVTQ